MNSSESKISSREQLVALRADWKKKKLKVGFTSGVFDLVHAGHVDYLARAKEQCDILIVAVNSDASVQKIKGPTRPICEEKFRLMVVSAFESVDQVYVFSEPNNNVNIEALKPDVYFKAGDYSKEKMSSAPIVESYGGEVVILPFLSGLSSSTLIERMVIDQQKDSLGACLPLPTKKRRAPAVFLDRDGTLIELVEYLHEPDKLKLLPGVAEGLKRLSEAGFYLVMVTNQPGIGMGYFSKEDFFRVSKEFLKQVSAHGVLIDKIYFSPYSKAENSLCRKPESGMIDRALRDLPIVLEDSVVVGDSTTDVQLAENLGIRSVLVKTGHKGEDALFTAKPSATAKDFKAAVDWIVGNMKISSSEEAGESAFCIAEDESDLEKLQALGALASKVGHDFNNILGTIQGCVDLIESRVSKLSPESNPIERQLSLMRSSLKKSVDFTKKLRAFVRPGPLALSQTTLGSCVRSVMGIFEDAGDLPCEFELNVTADPEVEIGEYVITQVISNICNNAIEAMSGQLDRVLVFHIEEIKVTKEQAQEASAKPGRYSRLSIVDHGTGMSDEVRDSLFEPFFSTKEKGIGKGMGLSMVMARAVLQQHKGFVTIDSKEDVGTVVQIYVPVKV